MFKKCFLLLVLLFMSAVGFADANTGGLSGTTSSAVADHTDLSMTYLNMVFGSVGSSFHGVSGQMLGMLFKQFNTGVLAALGILLSYTTVLTTIRITSEGMASGQNRNVHLMALRICAGFAAVVPNPNTGYNFAQVGLAAIVVQSVKLANNVWGIGLNYIKQGGTVWSDPNNAQKNPDATVDKIVGSSTSNSQNTYYGGDKGPLVKIFGNLYCMYSNYGQQLKDHPDSGVASPVVPTFADKATCTAAGLDVSTCENTLYFQRPGATSNSSGNFANIGGLNTGGCGTVTATEVFSGSTRNDQTKQYARMAVQAAVNTLAPVAKAAYCTRSETSSLCPTTPDTDDVKSLVNSAFAGGYLSFVGSALPISRAQNAAASTAATNFVSKAKRLGWAMAGRYYWDMTQVTTLLSKANDISNSFSSSGFNHSSMDNIPEATRYPLDLSKSTGVRKAIYNAKNASVTGSVDADKVGGAYKVDGASMATGVIATVLSILSPIFSFFGAVAVLCIGLGQATTNSVDPMMVIFQLGMQMINAAGLLIQGGILTAGIWGTANVPMACANLRLGDIYKFVNEWTQPICMFAAFTLIGSGVMLSYYTPIYPFVVYTFAVLGWLTVVIEAMVAMPLVALGLTHPEGHDFLGKAEQAMMLVLGVFLRPALMVIGLISAMILAFVGLKILNVGLAGVMGSIFQTRGWGGTHTGGLDTTDVAAAASSAARAMALYKTNNLGAMIIKGMITIPFFMMIYTSLIYQLISQCYRMVHVLPDYVMKWIGAPSQQSGAFQPDQAGSAVKQGAQGGVSASSQLAQRAVEAKKAHNQQRMKNKQNAQGKADSSTSGGGANVGGGG